MFNVGDKVRLDPAIDVRVTSEILNISIGVLHQILRDTRPGVVVEVGGNTDDFKVQFPATHIEFWFVSAVLLPYDDASPDLFHRTVRSVTSFYDRFGIEMSVPDTYAVFDEELREFYQASRRLLNSSGIPEQTRYETALEVADVFYTLIGHALALGLTPEQITQAVEKKVSVNDSKNANTHSVVTDPTTGKHKVTRRNLYIIASSALVANEVSGGRPYIYVRQLSTLRGARGEVLVVQSNWLSTEHRGAWRYAEQLAAQGFVVLTVV